MSEAPPSDPPPTSVFARSALLPEGWAEGVEVGIRGDAIAFVRSGVAVPEDALDVILPGIPNLHSHAFQRLIAGLAESRNARSDSFWSWRDHMFRVLGVLDPDTLEDVYGYVYATMLEAGYTSVAEFHYVHNDTDGRPYSDEAEMSMRAVAAARSAGLPITHLPVVYRRGGFDDAPLGPRQDRLACDVDQSVRSALAVLARFKEWDGVNVGLAPHSLRAVSPSDLPRLAQAAAELGPDSVIHIHISEQVQEVRDCLAAHGLTPIQLLLRSVDVGEDWTLVHCTQATAQELADVAARGAVVGLCPVTEANLGDGCIDLPTLISGGARFGIGSDSQASLDPWQELRLLEYAQRLVLRRRNIACDEHRSVSRFLVDHCAVAGAQALGRRTGRLCQGYKADLLGLRSDADPSLAMLSGDQFLDAWTFAADRPRPARVYAAGRLLVENGRHVASEPLKARYLRAVCKLRDRL